MAWIKLVNLSTRKIKGSWVPKTHCDPYWRIYWNQNPGANILIDGHTTPLLPEYIYILPAWLTWKGSLKNPVEHTWASFRTPQWQKVICQASFPKVIQLKVSSPRGSCMIEILNRFRLENESSIVEQEALALLALGQALSSYPIKKNSSPLLKKALDYIQDHPGGDLRVENLSKIQGCSMGHLSKLFQSQIGTSPSQVVRESRISFAADRLIVTQDSIEAIAEQSGFSNRFHFSRIFREVMDISPAAFRKQHWENSP